jgi:MHS family shikimate/dehydroshikimate transporter-like MFS transporter
MSYSASVASPLRSERRAAGFYGTVFACSIGTVIEWYDFLVYGTAAALIFGKLFFPAGNPALATLASLGTAAVGFFARPFGGAVFGFMGDRLGRRSMLLMSLLMMGIATFVIGLLPTYDQIGIWAPVLLVALRIVQGIGLGGEWGGAALMVLEHSKPGRRGFFGSLVQVGFPLGLILSTAVYLSVASLPAADLMSWGWRVPFLASIVLVVVGIFVRLRVEESPVFLAMKAGEQRPSNPLREVFTRQRRPFVIAIGLKLCEVSWVYLLTVFLVLYATTRLGLTKVFMLEAIMIAAAIEVFMIPLFGLIADRIGRRPLFFIGTVFTVVFAFPLFWMMETRDPVTIVAALTIALCLGQGLMFGIEATYFPELFGTAARCTGASLGFQVSAAIGGGLTPVFATLLVQKFGGSAGVSWLLIGVAVVTFVAALFARETLGKSISH